MDAIISGLVTGTITIDNSLTPESALRSVNRVEQVKYEVLKTMPLSTCGSKYLVFDKIGKDVAPANLDGLLKAKGLVPANPIDVMVWNAKHPEFADKTLNCTQWEDVQGNYCCVMFLGLDDSRVICVDRRYADYDDGWWFVCELVNTSDVVA